MDEYTFPAAGDPVDGEPRGGAGGGGVGGRALDPAVRCLRQSGAGAGGSFHGFAAETGRFPREEGKRRGKQFLLSSSAALRRQEDLGKVSTGALPIFRLFNWSNGREPRKFGACSLDAIFNYTINFSKVVKKYLCLVCY